VINKSTITLNDTSENKEIINKTKKQKEKKGDQKKALLQEKRTFHS
jgi:hypothetical protein